jgi:hypothetical protein
MKVRAARPAKGFCGLARQKAMAGRSQPMQKHALFGDYARTIARHAVTKATEKAIREAHLTALESVPAVIEEARAANWKAIR